MTMSEDSIIKLENVCFGYERREILHHVDLAIPHGAFAVIVGPNGGGKTTLLKLLIGLEKPRHGEVTILGGTPAEHLKRIGYVPQSLIYDSKFPVSALEVVLMGRVERHLFGPARRQDKEVAKKCLEQVGLAGFDTRHFSALSGGERQRVLIAQALACEPQILLLDEPGANLDMTSSHKIYELLKELNKTLTIILVSHNLEMVVPFASHVICVNTDVHMQPIAEVSAEAFENGDWLRLFHHSCPVDHCGGTNYEHQ